MLLQVKRSAVQPERGPYHQEVAVTVWQTVEVAYDYSGTGVIIHDERAARFLMQQKDGGHPLPEARNTLSIFGGKLEKGDAPFSGLCRELHEEFGCARSRALVCLHTLPWHIFKQLPWYTSKQYSAYIFVARIPDLVFDELADLTARPGAILEGGAAVKTRYELETALSDSSRFLKGVDLMLSTYLSQTTGPATL